MDSVISFISSIGVFLKSPTVLSMLSRLTIAAVFGAFIGAERGRKKRPAGLRTHMLVCLGAALTMVISQYLVTLGQTTDVTRFGAQVINGIGFLGAGSIIVTGRLEVKGLTTAAGLWATACMGLAVGAGFIYGAFIVCVLINVTNTVLSKLEVLLMSNSKNMNVYVEYTETSTIGDIIEKLKALDIRIFDIDLSRNINQAENIHSAMFDIKIPKKTTHAIVLTTIAEVSTVKSVEEL